MSAIKARRSREWQPDPESNMPAAVQSANHAWCIAAIDCYALRDAAEHYQDFPRADDYETLGDLYASRSRALLAEWEVLTSTDPATLYVPTWA
jgi:hypothetical protein